MEKRRVFSANGVGKTGQPHVKELIWTTFLHPTQNKLKMDERPKRETGNHQNPTGENRQQPL